ncbi:MAG: AI-2E family transporter [Verrucomicrobia bacterium]|jgi:predicted PurR-regulated permease PerM|nr:AI-2E family transporter [Verrucomicrobiota bacterium]
MSFPPPSDRQARIIWTACTGLALLVIVAVIVAVVWGLGHVLRVLAPVLWPLAIAGVLAYLLDPVVDWFERKGIPRTRAILLVLLMLTGLMLAVVSSVLPRVVVETSQLVSRIPAYAQRFETQIEEWLKDPPAPLRKLLLKGFPQKGTEATGGSRQAEAAPEVESLDVGKSPAPDAAPSEYQLNWDVVQSVSQWVTSALPTVGGWLLRQLGRLASWVGVVAGLALIPVYLFYFLLEKKAIAGRWAYYLPLQASWMKEEIVFVIRAINDHLIAFFRGQVLVAICDSVLYTIGFLIIGLDSAFLIGFCAVFLTIIPYIGAFIVCTSAVLLAIVQFGDVTHALLPLAVFGVVQIIEGFVLQPKILGDRVGLHPLVIIIAVISGTTLLGGLLGGILAIPVAAALRVILRRYVWVRAEPKL